MSFESPYVNDFFKYNLSKMFVFEVDFSLHVWSVLFNYKKYGNTTLITALLGTSIATEMN